MDWTGFVKHGFLKHGLVPAPQNLDVTESELECPNFTVRRKQLILLYVKINNFMNCLFRVR